MSKTIHILITCSEMQRVLKNKMTIENIQAYIAYLLQPYIQLKYFTFCDFSSMSEPIEGSVNPNLLLTEFQNLYKEQGVLLQHLCKTENSLLKAEYLKVISGRFNNNTFFYNPINDSTFIDEDTYYSVQKNPESYFLYKVNVYK